MYGSGGQGFAAAVIIGRLIGVSGAADGSPAQSQRSAGPGRPPQRETLRGGPEAAVDRVGAAPEFDASGPARRDFDQVRQSVREPRIFDQPGDPSNREAVNGESLNRDSMNRGPVNRGEPARPPFGSGRRHAESDRGGAPESSEGFGADATHRMTAADLDQVRAGRAEVPLGVQSTYLLEAGRGPVDSGPPDYGRGPGPLASRRGHGPVGAESTYRMAVTEPSAAVEATYRMLTGRRAASETGPGAGPAPVEATYRLSSVGGWALDRAAAERSTPERAESDRPEEARRHSGSRHADEGTTGFRTAELISATGAERVVSQRAQYRAGLADEAERALEFPREERRLDSPSQRAQQVVPSGPIEIESSRGPLGAAEDNRGIGFGTHDEPPHERAAPRGDQKSARSQTFRIRAIESSLPNAAVVSQQFGAEGISRPDDAPPAPRSVSGDGPIRRDYPMPTPVHESSSMRAVNLTSDCFATGGAPTADAGSRPGGNRDLRSPIDRDGNDSPAEPRRPFHDALERIETAGSRRSKRSWDGRYDSVERDVRELRRSHDDRAAIEDSWALGSLDSSALFGTLSGMRAVAERSER